MAVHMNMSKPDRQARRAFDRTRRATNCNNTAADAIEPPICNHIAITQRTLIVLIAWLLATAFMRPPLFVANLFHLPGR